MNFGSRSSALDYCTAIVEFRLKSRNDHLRIRSKTDKGGPRSRNSTHQYEILTTPIASIQDSLADIGLGGFLDGIVSCYYGIALGKWSKRQLPNAVRQRHVRVRIRPFLWQATSNASGKVPLNAAAKVLMGFWLCRLWNCIQVAPMGRCWVWFAFSAGEVMIINLSCC